MDPRPISRVVTPSPLSSWSLYEPTSDMRSTLLAVLSAALLVGTAGCTEEDTDSSVPEQTIPFEKEGEMAILQDADTLVVLDLEIAETDSARQRGMMQRDGFPDETSGMFFPFDNEEERSFWMANTPLSLDLFFINADSQIVRIQKYAQPNTAQSIPSNEPAQYVLETSAGFADSYGIVEGDRVRWVRTD